MREHLRSLIEQARKEADSRMNGSDARHETTITDRLGTDAVRLARLAAAVHMKDAAMQSATGSHSAPGTRFTVLTECER